jgi:hypothetical protein
VLLQGETARTLRKIAHHDPEQALQILLVVAQLLSVPGTVASQAISHLALIGIEIQGTNPIANSINAISLRRTVSDSLSGEILGIEASHVQLLCKFVG